MSEKQMEDSLKSCLKKERGPVPARKLVDQLGQQSIRPAEAKMAMLRLANRGELRVAADLTVELVAAQ